MSDASEGSEPVELLRPGLLLTLLLVIVAVVYAASLGGGFLWDDRVLIVDAPLVVELRSLHEYFTRPFWAGGFGVTANESYFRPLVILSYAFDYRLHHGNPAGFHLSSVLLHLVNTGLVYAYARRFTALGASAVAAAALWALAPRLTEAVAWISGRTDVLATTFVLLALVVPRTLPGRVLAALALLAGMLCKEVAIAGALTYLLREGLALRERRAGGAGAGASHYGPLLAACSPLIAYLALRAVYRGFHVSSTPVRAAQVPLVVLDALGRYFWMLLDPWQPRALSGRLGTAAASYVALGVAATIGVGVALFRARHWLRRHRQLLEPAFLALAALLPVLHVIPIPLRTAAADRFLYLPLVGVVTFGVSALEPRLRRQPAARLGLLALLVSLGVLTVRRVGEWADELAFWTKEQRTAPPHLSVALTELTGIYYRAALYDEARQLAERALATHDGYKLAAYNRMLCLRKLGQSVQARAVLVELAGEQPLKYAGDFAILELQQYEFASARRWLEQAVAAGVASDREYNLLELTAELGRLHARLQDPSAASGEGGQMLAAQLATRSDRQSDAVRRWQTLVSTAKEPAYAREAAAQLVRLGDLPTIESAIKTLQQRFGAVPAELEAAYDVRRQEVETALARKPELGLR